MARQARPRDVLERLGRIACGLASIVALAGSTAAAEPAAVLTRGPYLQRLGTDRATIVWRLDTAAVCGVEIAPFGDPARIVDGEPDTACAVTVTGLTPGTTYRYVPLADGAPVAPPAAFRTDHPALPYTFLVFGDSGNGSAEQVQVRDAMLASPADFVLHTGDMIYPQAQPEEWDPKFFQPYRTLLQRLVLWPCLGNHDVRDDGVSWREVFITPANNPAGSEDYYSFEHGNAHITVLDSNMSLREDSPQRAFLAADLAASTATWKFIVFHHTVYSSGEHTSDLAIRARIVPLVDAYGVDLVFMGHDHDYERTHPLRGDVIVAPGEGATYVTTGGGGGKLRPVGSSSFTAYAETALHFVRVTVAGGGLALEMVRADGTIGDTFALTKETDPSCGDGRVNRVEERCDGADDAACPGRCTPACECPPLCGDGVRHRSAEECDLPEDDVCPGLCIADCTCAEARPVREFEAVADTYIEAGLGAAIERGGSSSFSVDAQPWRVAYLRFDIEGPAQPLETATLTLYVTDPSPDGGTLYPVADSSWRETADPVSGDPGLRWIDVDTNSDGVIDGTDGSPFVPDFSRPLAAVGGVEVDEFRELDVTRAVLDGPGTYTLALRTAHTNGATYRSRDAAVAEQRPRLRLTFALECRSDAECDDGVFCNGAEACVRGHCEPALPVECDDGTGCGVGACDVVADACHFDPVADGTACDDGDACTQVDACVAGVCLGAEPVVCTVPDACRLVGVCDPATGECVYPPTPDGVLCDDRDACTRLDVCAAGVCAGTDPVVCVAVDGCHEIGTCDSATGDCSQPETPDGVACDDGDACMQTDACVTGVCVGGEPVVCAARDVCHVAGTCDPATGACSNPAAPDGSECDDGGACTQTDACVAGVCVGGEAVVCAARDGCHVAGTCDPATGACSNPAAPDGSECDDGDACTQTDACVAGACVGTQPILCPPPAQCQNQGVCDPATGQCQNPPVADGIACDDGQLCTRTDVCLAGACVGTEPVICTPLDDCHAAGVCNPLSGLCSHPIKPDGTACDDGDLCTRADLCHAGACVVTEPVVCRPLDDCHLAGVCDPATGVCSSPPAAGGTPCDDGDACTQVDTCVAGACVGTQPILCPRPEQCRTDGACDPATGACSSPPATDGTLCDDGNPCTQTDMCVAGACAGIDPVRCPPPALCHTAGECDPGTGACVSLPLADGTSCDDGDACTRADTCVAGACLGGAPVVCPAPDQCHGAGVCDPVTGVCSGPPLADGTPCDDGDACTQSDTCAAGACTGRDPVVCPPPIACLAAGICNPATGQCASLPLADGTPCEDGNLCTAGDACISGFCAAGTENGCPPPDACREIAGCDSATGACMYRDLPDGTPCDDGNRCTRTDVCQAGACGGTDAVQCPVPETCHAAGGCDPATGACTSPPLADGTTCDDGDACTRTDVCADGDCVGTEPVVCAASGQCREVGACDSATGECSQPEKPDGVACDDGDACTTSDVCVAGACAAGERVRCPAVDQCHAEGTCDPATGVCSHPAKAGGTSCDDGDACTRADVCVAGVCVGGAPVVCVPSDQCHVAGTCDRATGACTDPLVADSTPCDDGDACTQVDVCRSGMCVGTEPVVCTASGVCREAGTCDSATGVCATVPSPAGTPCDDGNRCTQVDVCQGGACVGFDPVVCTAVDQCHQAGVCNVLTGRCSHPARPDGAACDDIAFCTVDDACRGGVCAGSLRACAGGADPCSAGACDEGHDTCVLVPKSEGAACDDRTFCTLGDTCLSGRCAGAPRDCTAGEQCRTGTCDETAGACVFEPRPDGVPCDDGAFCTVDDVCAAGTCAGVARDCSAAGGTCADGVCRETARTCVPVPKTNGVPCDDGAFCTVDDACAAGTCVGAARDCGAAASACTTRICDEAAADCVVRARPDGTACDDGDACTRRDVCTTGVCEGNDAIVCMPADDCHDGGVCDPSSAACSRPPKPDGAVCDDGDACTDADQCAGGICRGEPLADADADGVCDAVDICPLIADPGQGDTDMDGMGDACQCTEPAPGQCIAGGGSTRTDCWLEFMTTARVTLNRKGTRVKRIVRCRDGELGCDQDGARDGVCSFGVALCFGNADPRYPLCSPTHIRSVEVMRATRAPADLLASAERLERVLAGLGLEVVRRGRVVAAAVEPVGDNHCSSLVRLETPAPAGTRAVRRKFTLGAQNTNGRRDKDRFVLVCES